MCIIKAFLSLFKKDSAKKEEVIKEKPKMLTYDKLLKIKNKKNPNI